VAFFANLGIGYCELMVNTGLVSIGGMETTGWSKIYRPTTCIG